MHLDNVTRVRDVFPRRTCACTLCSSASIVPRDANTAAANAPCFLDETSADVDEFFDWTNGVWGSRCWTLDGGVASHCLTPGDALSQAPARGSPLPGGGHAPTRVMFLVGDSHALHLVAGLGAAIAGEYSLAYSSTLEGAGFNPVWPNVGADYACQVDPSWVCRYWARRHVRYGGPAWVDAVRATLASQLRAGDVLTIVNAWLRMVTIEYVDAYMAFVAELCDMAAQRGATVLLIGDLPRILRDGRECTHPTDFGDCATPRERAWRLGWPVHPADHPTVTYAWSLHATLEARFEAFAQQTPNALYITSQWMFDQLCDPHTGLCGPTVPGTETVAYFDSHHLSTAGSMYLAPLLNCKLRDLGLL